MESFSPAVAKILISIKVTSLGACSQILYSQKWQKMDFIIMCIMDSGT